MLERILSFSIRHRYLVVLVTLLVAGIGAWSAWRLPIDAVPDVTNNQVQVNTVFAALSPLEIEQQVTYPVETALAGIPGLEYTRSISRNGFSQVTAVFEDGLDIYFARQQVNERLGEARETLPPGAEPSMGPITTGLGEVFMYTVNFAHPNGTGATVADGRPGWQSDGTYLTPEGDRLASELERGIYLRTVQDWIIRPQLRGVRDVAGVDAIGGFVKQYHVRPDPMTLVGYGLTFHDVIEALERNNVSTGAGFIERKGEAYTVRAAGRIEDERQIGEIVVATRGGVPIRVGDVATVAVGGEPRAGSASENGEEVVVGTAMMLIGANSRTVAADVGARVDAINRSLPADIVAKPVLDRTKLVDATIRTVATNLAEGAILVVVVLFVLLGNFRAALLTSLAIPISMLITATGMVQGGISGNLLSLGAIDFGIIVDGSVIIVENCLRRLAERQRQLGRTLTLEERLETVFAASKEVRSATAFGEAIIITVYLPILALTGVEGKMFTPMALTVILALVAAFVLSLTFIPAMVAILIRGKVREQENVLIRVAKHAYAPLLRWSLRLRWAVVGVAVAAFAGSLVLFTRLGQEFAPTLDEKDIAMHAVRIASTGIAQATQMQKEVERTLATFPEVRLVFSKNGTAEVAADPMPPNVSDTFIILRPQQEWRSEAELDRLVAAQQEVAESLGGGHHDAHGDDLGDAHGDEHARGDGEGVAAEAGHDHGPPPAGHKGKLIRLIELTLQTVPGNNYEFSQPIQMRFNELISGVRSDVAVKVYGDDFAQMRMTAEAVATALRGVAGAADVKVEQTEGLPLLNVAIDREAIARYGLDVADVQDVLSIAVGGRAAGQVFEGDRRFDLVVRMPEALRGSVAEIENLPIPLPAADDSATADHRFASAGDDARAGDHRPGHVSLSALANVELTEGPNQISRENGKRRIVVQANVRERDLGSFVADARAAIDREVTLAAGNWLAWGGQFENLVAARQRLSIVVPACFFLIVILLFATFNSVKHALLVFVCVPLALTGGIVALWLRDMPFSISAAVGFIALSGVAVLNGLVMVTFINQLRAGGAAVEDAILTGSLTRLRPVMMTALVASLGFVPMALATGTGAEVQRPLATVVIGGIVSSTILTLLVLPALYRLLHRRAEVG